MKNVVIVGGGGHSRVICDILLQMSDIRIIGLLDPAAGKAPFDIPLLGDDSKLIDLYQAGIADSVFIALGDNALRKKLSCLAQTIGYSFVNAVSPWAVVSPHAILGNGIAIMPGGVINAGAQIGDGCIINTNASVDHDDRIGAWCHIAPGVTICGTATIGEMAFIGAGARVIDGIRIGRGAMIGAGAAVINDIPDHVLACGVPAVVKKHFGGSFNEQS